MTVARCLFLRVQDREAFVALSALVAGRHAGHRGHDDGCWGTERAALPTEAFYGAAPTPTWLVLNLFSQAECSRWLSDNRLRHDRTHPDYRKISATLYREAFQLS